jgi:TPR repeat protein
MFCQNREALDCSSESAEYCHSSQGKLYTMFHAVLLLVAVPATEVEAPIAPAVAALARQYATAPSPGIEEKLQTLVEAGSDDAAALLGEILQMRNRPGGPDFVRACRFHAMSKRASAVHNAATCLFKGEGGEKDLPRARALYKVASEGGFLLSRCALGNMLISGQGGSKLVDEGMALCRSAAEAGSADAQADYGGYLLMGTVGQRDPVEARKWFRLAADQKHANASYVLGQIYWKGDGIGRDRAEAARWMKQAFELGRSDASSLLATEALNRALSSKDGQPVINKEVAAEAMKWARIASNSHPDPKERQRADELIKLLAEFGVD